MNGLDIALVVVLFFFFVRGIFRGFVKEVAGIVGLVLGFLLASSYHATGARYLEPVLHNASYRQAISFLIIFVLVFFIVGLLGLLVDKLVKLTVSNVANGLLGAVVALVKGLVLAAVVLMVISAFLGPETPFFKESATWPYMRRLSVQIREWVPADLRQALEYKSGLLPDELPLLPPADGKDSPWKPALPAPDPAGSPAWPGNPENS